MVVIDIGDKKTMYVDGKLKSSLDVAITRVKKKNWDYVAVIAGYSGAGKSTLARTIAKYCCPWFDENYIAFTGKEFIKMTNEAPEYSAVILDESFQSLNTRNTMNPEFMKIINHLQIIRQKHLFILLCLPNFFELSKGIAIFRSSHLFVVYASDEGDRGKFLAFGRDRKRLLYIKGLKYMDYGCEKANFFGRFAQNKDILDETKYEAKKFEHLMEQSNPKEFKRETKREKRNKVAIWKLNKEKGWSHAEIARLFGVDGSAISHFLMDYEDNPNKSLNLDE
jgi:ABC-type dipeptide/oligopeptide/nickel transport system ATPase subunit